MAKIHSTQKKNPTAVMVAVGSKRDKDEQMKEHLDELEFLASTINIDVKERFTQKLEHPDKRTYVGSGKLNEIIAYVKDNKIDQIIFDDELSPSQVRNLEKEVEVKIYDRSLLILDIFLYRAQTAQAKTQVELARSEYLLPRLTRMWTHLERQRGGTGTRGGAGEQEIETDRRLVRKKITDLKKKLDKIDQQNYQQRSNRGGLVRVSLVGYTNVGKSTLMNILSKANIFAENKLFATVDSTVRKVNFDGIPFLLSDTVGFIRKLPHGLIECFKSTLDEVREADILLHVIDVSHKSFEDHKSVVNQTLKEINAADKLIIHVFNKIDLFEGEDVPTDIEGKIEYMKNTYFKETNHHAIYVSALNKINMDELRQTIISEVASFHQQRFPNYLG